MQHRLILLAPHPQNFADDLEAFHEHWNVAHAELLLPVEQVIGYIQNRPVDPRWQWTRFHGVAELFFESPQTEEAAWGSQPWVEGVEPDEHHLLDVENGWSTIVASTDRVRGGEVLPFRVLAFGGEPGALPAGTGAATRMHLEQAPPVEGAADTVLAVFAADEGEARGIAAAVGGTALVAHGTQVIDVPEWPWAGSTDTAHISGAEH